MAAPWFSHFFKLIYNLLSRAALGPVVVLLFAGLIALLNKQRAKDVTPSISCPDYSDVDDWYGPGAYYGWLVTAVAAVCQSDPEPPSPRQPLADADQADANTETMKQFRDRIALLEAILTFAAVAYPSAAAIDMMIRMYRTDFGNQFAAADRTAQVGWIFASFYLLHHVIGGGVVMGRTRVPCPTTIMWMCLWALITGAMGADNVIRRHLGSTSLRVFLPFVMCIPTPMVMLAGWRWWRRRDEADIEGWLISALNVGTYILCVGYVLCPGHFKYDPESPQAPRSGSHITDMGQAATLAVAIVGSLPPLAVKSRGIAKRWFARE